MLFYLLLLAFNLNAELSENASILPLPQPQESLDADKIDLGLKLFQDPRLSRNNTISCSTCHNLDQGGVDHKETSIGINGAVGDINAPTVFNSGFNFRQFWNGRAKSLEEQVDGPVQNPKEMGSDWADVVAKLEKDPQFVAMFKKSYGKISRENIKKAIANFERSLITPNSRFDRYISGENSVLSAQEINGYQLFKSYGCVSCHQCVNVGGNMYQTMGVMGNYFQERKKQVTDADLGHFTVTRNKEDKFLFRVPSLRNVQSTAPYFHDGSAQTLEDAVKIMAKYQLGQQLTKSEVDSIVAFLKTLTGDKPKILKSNNKDSSN